jgi:hypothetical protein
VCGLTARLVLNFKGLDYKTEWVRRPNQFPMMVDLNYD